MASCLMKWHIFNGYNKPLCWNQQVLEFDEEWQAERFLKAYCKEVENSYEEYCKGFGVTIKNSILFYDNCHLDCSHKVPVYDKDWEGQLIDVE